MEGFASVEDVEKRLESQGYVCSRQLVATVFLAERMDKPILVEGPAGVGKTELAKALAGALDRRLIRLQCYEGLDETKALYEWEYAKQLLYTQLLKEKIDALLEGCTTLSEAVNRISAQEGVFFSEKFLLPRPLLRAVLSDEPTVLLIDEVDKADPEFEAFLLEILSEFQVSVPELGTIRARQIPICVLTSNNSREITDTLKRRCLHLYIDYPDRDSEVKIVRLKVPELPGRLTRQIVEFIQHIREMDLKKCPGISETLDWARALVLLNANRLDKEVIRDTLNLFLKHREDAERLKGQLDVVIQQVLSG
jgi:MoxR-like ATPase